MKIFCIALKDPDAIGVCDMIDRYYTEYQIKQELQQQLVEQEALSINDPHIEERIRSFLDRKSLQAVSAARTTGKDWRDLMVERCAEEQRERGV